MYFSIVVMLSRPESLELVFDNLRRILMKKHFFELVIVVDNMEISESRLVMYMPKIADWNFRNIQILHTRNKKPKPYDMLTRRKRIADNHNYARDHIGGSHFVFGFEDDTILPRNALSKLFSDYTMLLEKYDIGMIEGVQIGRWGVPYVGAWQVDDIREPTNFRTILPAEGDKEKVRLPQPIDAGGYYCFFTTTENYKMFDHHAREPAGSDVWFGLKLRQQGMQNFIDWSIQCGHRAGNRDIYMDENTCIVDIQLVDGRWHTKAVKK